MELSTKEVKYPTVALKSYDDWNDFYENLEKLCRSMKYWDKVNPDLPDLDSDILVKPAVLTPEQCLDFVLSKIQSRTGTSTAVSSATTETSDTTPPLEEDLVLGGKVGFQNVIARREFLLQGFHKLSQGEVRSSGADVS
ncbi:hypothetical protein E4U35_001007 [Claviceps purpurea]|nr:hypothetical protein E4U35_001007 [Claviceps purpurea]KAG6249615.1 hypothetical protein E4U24_002075 [Claviceps purpurea]KAG6260856.1 hypothetical protein E4U49_004452 [Claviceps purpurea]